MLEEVVDKMVNLSNHELWRGARAGVHHLS